MNEKDKNRIEDYKLCLLQKQEWQLYFTIEKLRHAIGLEKELFADGLFYTIALGEEEFEEDYLFDEEFLSEEELQEQKEYYSCLFAETLRLLVPFGVAMDSRENTYKRWYLFWKSWSRSLTPNQIVEIKKRIESSRSIEGYLPPRPWS